MKFDHIIYNYRSIYRLGMKIINHKHQIKYVPDVNIDVENNKQQERIEKFEKMVKKTNREWKLNKRSINEYWSGD
tara:strand:- start:997 stop:1221 length:225 start_codon:yes stop_codon:yes gene_type:complete